MPLRMIVTVCAMIFLGAVSNAAVPTSITVQGKLTDAAGNPLPGATQFVFKIFGDTIGGGEHWPGGLGETQTITVGNDGLWIGRVGALSPLSDAVFSDSSVWLQITAAGTTLPRVRLLSEPFAFRVATVDGASGGIITSKVSIGSSTNSGNHAFAAGFGNAATGEATVALGSSNAALAGFSAVLGGNSNQTLGQFATVAGGASNRARGDYSAIVGGGGTAPIDSNSAAGAYAFVGAGKQNQARYGVRGHWRWSKKQDPGSIWCCARRFL